MDVKFKIGTVVFDHWRIVRMLGSSSSGSLYQLAYKDHGREYRAMLKVVSVPKDLQELVQIQQATQNFESYFDSVLKFMLDEVDILAQLGGNPYVLNYFDHKVERHPSGMGYDLLLRTEQLPALSEVELSKPLHRKEVLQMGIDLCKALEECHENGVIHRDIRPDHIYVTAFGGFKLGNFGLPCVNAKDLPSLSGFSWEFMSPEIYRDEEYDHTVDIYSLGLVLFYLLHDGRLPFYPPGASAQGKEQARARRMRGEVWLTPPSLRRGKVGKVLAKACHFEPRFRYQKAEDFRRDLEVVLQRENAVITLPVEVVRDTVESFGKTRSKQFLGSIFG